MKTRATVWQVYLKVQSWVWGSNISKMKVHVKRHLHAPSEMFTVEFQHSTFQGTYNTAAPLVSLQYPHMSSEALFATKGSILCLGQSGAQQSASANTGFQQTQLSLSRPVHTLFKYTYAQGWK